MASVYTNHYNLDKYTGNDKPNLRDQYNAAMDKIDAQMYTNSGLAGTALNSANAASTSAKTASDKVDAEVARAKAEESKLSSSITNLESTLETQISNATDSITAGYTAAIKNETDRATAAESELNRSIKAQETVINNEVSDLQSADATLTSNVNEILARFPIKSNDLQDGSVTATKINQTGVKSILNGFTVHFFNNKDPNADNVGLVAPSNARISGFYIEELTLLCITQLQVYGEWMSIKHPDGKIVLPSYVPAIVPPQTQDANEYIISGGACVWNDSSTWKTWCGYSIVSGRQISPRSDVASRDWFTTFGSAVAILRPYMTSTLDTQTYDALVSANEVM